MYSALESLRGVAALLVVFMHEPFVPAPGRDVSAFGLAVDFFFILSGFVVTHAYRDRVAGGMGLGRYLVLRIGRLAPLNALILLLWVPFYLWRLRAGLVGPDSPAYTLEGFVRQILMLDVLHHGGPLQWNRPAWSISAEAFAYLAFFAVVRLAGTRLTALSASFVSVAAYSTLYAIDPRLDLAVDYISILRCAGGFFAGVAIYHLHEARSGSPRFGTGVECAAVLLAVFVLSLAHGEGARHVAAALSLAPLVLIFARGRGALSRLLNLGAFRVLGRISFSLYLVHMLVSCAIRDAYVFLWLHPDRLGIAASRIGELAIVVPGLAANVALDLAVVIASVAVAALVHRYFEEPMRQRSRRLAARPGLPPALADRA